MTEAEKKRIEAFVDEILGENEAVIFEALDQDGMIEVVFDLGDGRLISVGMCVG